MGSAARMRASNLIRRHLGATVALALFAGLAGGVSLGLWGIARRTASSLERFTAFEDAGELTLFTCPDGTPPPTDGSSAPSCPDFDYADVFAFMRTQPAVQAIGRYTLAITGVARKDDPQNWSRELIVVAIDQDALIPLGNPIVVAGRLADPKVASEVVVNESEQKLRHLALGDQMIITPYGLDEFDAAGEGTFAPTGTPTTVTVVGVVRHPNDLTASSGDSSLYVNRGLIQAGPAWWAQIDGNATRYGLGAAIKLAMGAAVGDVEAAFVKQWPDRLKGFDPAVGPFPDRTVGQAIALEARSFQLLAIFVGLASAVFVGQAIARQARREWSDSSLLGAIGMTKDTMVSSQSLRSAVIAVGAAITAMAVAIALSPLGPIGVGRAAEPFPGLHTDWFTLAVGLPIVVTVVLVAAIVPVATLRRARSQSTRRPSRLASKLPSTGVAGLAMTGSRRAGGLALGSAIGAVALASTVGMSAWSLTASYNDLVDHPARYGATWDAIVGNDANAAQAAASQRRLEAIPGIRAAGIQSVNDGPGGNDFTLTGFEPLIGEPSEPTITRGRVPAAAKEVALGRGTMADLGVDIGDMVHLPPGDPSQGADLKVVGEVVVNDGIEGSQPGKGAFVVPATIPLLLQKGDTTRPASYAVWIGADVDRAATLAALHAAFPTTFDQPRSPSQISNLGLIKSQPVLLALIVSFIAGAALIHALVLSVRRGRRQIGILKTVGFTRAQVSGSVAWHATLLVLPGLVVGLPLGIAVGRLVWKGVVDTIGIVSDPVLPLVAMLATVFFVIVIANLAALGPAWSAGRTRAALMLRAE